MVQFRWRAWTAQGLLAAQALGGASSHLSRMGTIERHPLGATPGIDGGDAIAKFAQGIFHDAPDLIRQGLMTFDVICWSKIQNDNHADRHREG